jgi:hypothetical protein
MTTDKVLEALKEMVKNFWGEYIQDTAYADGFRRSYPDHPVIKAEEAIAEAEQNQAPTGSGDKLYTIKLSQDDIWYDKREFIEGKPLKKLSDDLYGFANPEDKNEAEWVCGPFVFFKESEVSELTA